MLRRGALFLAGNVRAGEFALGLARHLAGVLASDLAWLPVPADGDEAALLPLAGVAGRAAHAALAPVAADQLADAGLATGDMEAAAEAVGTDASTDVAAG